MEYGGKIDTETDDTVNVFCRTFWNINDYDLRQLVIHYHRSVEQIANKEMKWMRVR